jgi:archaellum component FlaC
VLSQFTNWLKKALQTRVVLEHPEAPEDTRVLNLFRNRAALKKSLGDSQDELHRLKDRVKLQEAATARVREQMEQLESRLAQPMTGLHALLHYQLRDLWAAGHAQIAALVRELAQQREDRERRQFLADLNRQLFERQQSARAACAQAEHGAADVRARIVALQGALGAAQSWWQYFTRRELARRAIAMRAEMHAAEETLQQARERLQQIEEQGGAKYPGLSLPARRVLNLNAIATAQVLALRLVPPALLARAADAMSRSEPRIEGVQDAAGSLALMQEIGRVKAAMAQNGAAISAEVRRLVDTLAAGVKYRAAADTTPTVESVQLTLRSALARSEAMTWDVLDQDLWSVSDMFYADGD